MRNLFSSIYVNENGNDCGSGSREAPFKTIARARDEVRKISPKMDGDIIVHIDQGFYPQKETLVFDERDSGQNGWNIIYCGTERQFPVISGGKKVTGWEPYEKNIWRAKVEGMEVIRELYVNGKKQRLARTNARVTVHSFYHPSDDPSKNLGIIMDKKELEHLTNTEDLVFRYTMAWMCYYSRCEGIVPINDREWAAVLQPAFHDITTRGFNSPTERTSLYIENAYELLDTPGEFYYNAREGYLYYMPEDETNLETAEVYIPVLEHLIDICGSDLAHKVHNITFENLHFAHATYLYPVLHGFNSTQAQMVSTMTQEREIFFTPSNITLDATEEINFYNNDFSGLGAVALGLHNGVRNTKIVGNTFYDIKDSAISVGLVTHDYIDEAGSYYDLAPKSTVTASSWFGETKRPHKAIDGNIESGWCPKTDGVEWIQFDLKNPFHVEGVDLYLRQGIVTEILLSNDQNFTEAVPLQLNSQEEVIRRQSYNILDATLTKYSFLFNCPDNAAKYRYVRVICTNNAWICDAKIYDFDRTGIPLKEVCQNTLIKNNYFNHVADYYWSSPAVTGYYVDSLEISHNYFNFSAYSAISCGWGWSGNRASKTCRNNRITDNFIKDCTLECYDGGGIYTLGNQPGSIFSGNYIYGQHYPTAALYLDSGSSKVLWSNNVTEEIGKFFYSDWRLSSQDYKATDNHTSADIFLIAEAAHDALVNTHVYPKFMPDADARIIMENAGLEDAYIGIMERVPTYENYTQFGLEGYRNVVENAEWPAHYARHIFLECEINGVEHALNLTTIGQGLWQFTAEAKTQLQYALQHAQEIVSDQDRSPNDMIFYEEWLNLRQAYSDFLESRNKLTLPELQALVQETLDKAVAGTEAGCYPPEAIARLHSQLYGKKVLKTKDAYLDLEQSYFAFLAQKIA